MIEPVIENEAPQDDENFETSWQELLDAESWVPDEHLFYEAEFVSASPKKFKVVFKLTNNQYVSALVPAIKESPGSHVFCISPGTPA